MEAWLGYLLLFAIVFGVNMMPAFGPPTWSIIVLYGLNSELPTAAIILVAAAASASGRYLLAVLFRALGRRIPRSTRENLAAARALFERNPRNGIVALGLFALSPLPSAQLFEAAGLAGVGLARFTIVFFIGRTVSYTIYVASAREIKESSLAQMFESSLSSPAALALQVAMIVGLIALARIDWRRLLDRLDEREGRSTDVGKLRGGDHG